MASLKDLLESSGAEILDTSGRKLNIQTVQQKIDTSNQISSIFVELKSLSSDEKTEWVNIHKLIGNKYYRCGNYIKAQQIYMETITAAKILKDEETVFIVLCNLAMCLIALEQYSAAVKMTEKALKIKPDHFLALEKRARANFAIGKIEEADEDLVRAFQTCEEKSTCAKIVEFREKIRKVKVEKSKMYKKMIKTHPESKIKLPEWVLTVTKFVIVPLSWMTSLTGLCRRKQKQS